MPRPVRDKERREMIRQRVARAIEQMIAETRGTMVSFKPKHLACKAGLPPKAYIHTTICHLLEPLVRRGLIILLARTSHGLRYAIPKFIGDNKINPLWQAALDRRVSEYI